MQPTVANQGKGKRVHTETATSCTHGRVVDEVRNSTGVKTGRLICKECLAEFPDPTYRKPD